MQKREWLIEIRGNRTQEEVARMAGISRSAYSNIENGRGLSVKLAKQIGRALLFDWKLFFADDRFDTNRAKSA